MADPSIISNAFENYPIMQGSKRYDCYLYALIARWVHGTPNFQLSYYDVLCSPAAYQLLSAAMLKVPKSQNFINFVNLFTEHLCNFTGEKFISTFAPDLFAGDPKAVFDYLLSTQPDNTLYSDILSALKLQAVLITKQNLFHNSYPALHKRLSTLEDYRSILFRAFQESDYYGRTPQLFTFDEKSFFKLWLLVNGVEFAPQPVSVKRNTSAPLKSYWVTRPILNTFFNYSSLPKPIHPSTPVLSMNRFHI